MVDRDGSISATCEQALDQLLAEDRAAVLDRERKTLDDALQATSGKVVLVGAGTLGRQALLCLRTSGVEPLAFADTDYQRWGSEIEGVRVMSRLEASGRFGKSAAFLVTIWNNRHRFIDTLHELTELGCQSVLPAGMLRWKYSEQLLPFYWEDLPHKVLEQRAHVRQALSLWSDERSRREYVAQVGWRLTGHILGIGDPVEEVSYFPDDLFAVQSSEHFVDCGAYDGDTIGEFLKRSGGRFNQVTAIEPDPKNYCRLEEYVRGLDPDVRRKVLLKRAAVDRCEGVARFHASADEGAAFSVHGELEVECVSLDTLLAGTGPTYIKMDIEGAELQALLGAEKTIRAQRPVLAICVYHTQDHLWHVPLLLSRFCEDYRLFLRPHEGDGWQLVCYALPPERALGGPRRNRDLA